MALSERQQAWRTLCKLSLESAKGPHVSDQLYELACEAFDLAREYLKQEMPEKSLAEHDQIIAQYFVIARTRSKPERERAARDELH